jgi:hypothetical protein
MMYMHLSLSFPRTVTTSVLAVCMLSYLTCLCCQTLPVYLPDMLLLYYEGNIHLHCGGVTPRHMVL